MEFKPKIGDRVLVSNSKNGLFESRIYLFSADGFHYCVDSMQEKLWGTCNDFNIVGWSYIKPLEEENPIQLELNEGLKKIINNETNFLVYPDYDYILGKYSKVKEYIGSLPEEKPKICELEIKNIVYDAIPDDACLRIQEVVPEIVTGIMEYLTNKGVV